MLSATPEVQGEPASDRNDATESEAVPGLGDTQDRKLWLLGIFMLKLLMHVPVYRLCGSSRCCVTLFSSQQSDREVTVQCGCSACILSKRKHTDTTHY